jgi:hypothetical protein
MIALERDWKEEWVDRMGLIVCLSGSLRFDALREFKRDMGFKLSNAQIQELKACLKARFTPTNGEDGCQSGTSAVREVAG